MYNTTSPVTLDSWYEHTDGSYGFYAGAARAGGPTMTRRVATAAECVDCDEHGALIAVGWPAKSVYGTYDAMGNWTLSDLAWFRSPLPPGAL